MKDNLKKKSKKLNQFLKQNKACMGKIGHDPCTSSSESLRLLACLVHELYLIIRGRLILCPRTVDYLLLIISFSQLTPAWFWTATHIFSCKLQQLLVALSLGDFVRHASWITAKGRFNKWCYWENNEHFTVTVTTISPDYLTISLTVNWHF